MEDDNHGVWSLGCIEQPRDQTPWLHLTRIRNRKIMLKVVIVDDEPMICSLIKNLVDWEELGYKIIGTAFTGIDALEVILASHPDVVITDIRMPGYDGLELIRRTKEAGLEPEFIMISGFRQFEYAQTAMKYGVKYYLLKPIEEDKVVEIMEEIRSGIEERLREAGYQRSLEKQIAEGKDRMKRRFLSSMVYENSFMQGPSSRDSVNREFSTSFSEGCYRAVYVKVDVETDEEKYLHTVLEHVSLLIADELSFAKEQVSIETHSGVISLFNYSAEQEDMVREVIVRIDEKADAFLEQFEGFHAVVGAGIRTSDFYRSRECIQSAIDAIKYRIRIKDRVIFFDAYSFRPYHVSDFITPQKKQDFLAKARACDHQSIEEMLYRDFHEIRRAAPEYSPVCYFDVFSAYMELLQALCREHDYYDDGMKAVFADMNQEMDSVTSAESLLKIVLKTAKGCLERIEESRRNRSIRPVRTLKEYIEANYQDEISLNRLADLVNLNASYVSSMFKKETGKTYSEYLTDVRIRKAKDLLVETGDSIGMIAEKTGYHDARYFSKQFSRIVGLKPFEYRKLYS